MILLAKNDPAFTGFLYLPAIQKCQLLQISIASPKKKVRKYVQLLLFLEEKHSLQQLAKAMHIKEKYIRKYVAKLNVLGFIKHENEGYRTIIPMDLLTAYENP